MIAKPFVPLDFPPWIKWRARKGATLPEGIKDAEGNPCCRWCHAPIKKRGARAAWCTQAHAENFHRVFGWSELRAYIFGRDGGRCTRCGTDHPDWKHTGVSYGSHWRGIGQHCALKAAWEVDHILPVRMGGTDDPANLRLTCKDCHIAIGYEQRANAKAVAA